MSDTRILKRLLYGQLKDAKRHAGEQCKRCKDQLRGKLRVMQPQSHSGKLWQKTGLFGGN